MNVSKNLTVDASPKEPVEIISRQLYFEPQTCGDIFHRPPGNTIHKSTDTVLHHKDQVTVCISGTFVSFDASSLLPP